MSTATKDWEIRFSNSRQRPYFYSPSTKESVWETPEGLNDDDVLRLPGAHHIQGIITGQGLGGAVAAPPAPVVPSGKVRASHLLVKHNQSRRPASWKEPNITRPKSEAIAILNGHLAILRSVPPAELKDKFAAIAYEHSDCSSHSHGGDLGPFGRGQMQKPFEDATYALEVGQLSGIVDTDSGVHLVLRTA